MIYLTTPAGRVAIDESRISAISEEKGARDISCQVWVGETLSDSSGFNIIETYDEVLDKVLKLNINPKRQSI